MCHPLRSSSVSHIFWGRRLARGIWGRCHKQLWSRRSLIHAFKWTSYIVGRSGSLVCSGAIRPLQVRRRCFRCLSCWQRRAIGVISSMVLFRELVRAAWLMCSCASRMPPCRREIKVWFRALVACTSSPLPAFARAWTVSSCVRCLVYWRRCRARHVCSFHLLQVEESHASVLGWLEQHVASPQARSGATVRGMRICFWPIQRRGGRVRL